MQDLVIASDERDAAAAQAVEGHHAEMAGTLRVKVAAVVAAASGGRAMASAARDLGDWCESELLPHALAEETTLYREAGRRPEGRLLVEAMRAEHEVITDLVGRLSEETDPVRVAATATALLTVFDTHLVKENELVVPLLVGAPDVSLADLLGGMHELLGGGAAGAVDAGGDAAEVESPGCRSGAGGHTCGCGGSNDEGLPELDARAVPHAIRHATIFGALDGVRPGDGMVLVAPHDPVPLLAQLEQRSPGAFDVSYVERGPETWRVAFVRT